MPQPESDGCQEIAPIREWLVKQPHLPHDIDDILLKRFYASCNKSTERAKKTLDLFFTIRSSAPELFSRRDPMSPEIQRVFDITDMMPLPNKTKENYRVFLYRLNNPDYDLFNFIDGIKTFFMLADTRLTEETDIPSGEIPIFDTMNINLKFMSKINLPVLRKYMLYTQEALPIRLKQVHIINAPSYVQKMYAMCKPFIKPEVAEMIKFHEPDSDTLYTDVPKELLPKEYGGQAGTVDDIKQYWIKRIEAKREWFLKNDEKWAVNEELRPKECMDDRADQIKGLPGSFRSLAFD
ncbi:alpha-tocopherol transfer protein-like [Aricia agestis]|uniref:alpha-tocopherol transfer protein-like n=1 Tax=Aricia agestis TaxID=91739 RepID=UPI001C202B74|nr:alpha-tocopherol transfer protein-like [Aricia agestis]